MTRLATATNLGVTRVRKFKEMSNVLTPHSQPITSMKHPCGLPLQKRKADSKIDKGLKWFKGSPKKSSKKCRLLKSAPDEPLPVPSLPVTIAARVVEFDIGGTLERLGVTERLELTEEGVWNSDSLDDTVAKLGEDIPKVVSPSVGPGRKPKTKCGKGLVKSKKNGKIHTPLLETGLKELTSPPVSLPEPNFNTLSENEGPTFARPNAYIRYMEASQEELSDEVEYDMEEEDVEWLQLTNVTRKRHGLALVNRRDMEFVVDRLEKESYFQMQSTGMDHGPPIDDDAVCCICMDGECQNSNAILFCDMCNLAVHQDCYGVPYIPEGQWLCRKCLHSPSRAVECVLCPNKGGALKLTDDGRWAHVACAIWIPEVCFANTVFLEPIESIANIPAARWRLTCFICKQKGIGACIQCYKTSCYTAFHVTCAQQANLVMKMETVREMHMTSVIIKKTAYCNNHAPPNMLLEKKLKDGAELASPRMKMKQTRKILAEKRDAIAAVLIPTIPKNRITAISNRVNFPGKPTFMKRVMAYWKLKRQLRNGVPLLRRFQMSSSAPNSKPVPSESKPKTRLEQQEHFDHYISWIRLRQDLEKARLLCEMIRKRERLKRELIYSKVKVAEMEVFPMQMFFLNILDEISGRDSKEIFHYPVDVDEVTDYLTKIKEPTDLSTMRDKVNRLDYSSLDELESDFNLMISNCLLYNDKDTIYYKTALRIRAFGSVLFRKAKKIFQSVGYEGATGLHTVSRPVIPPSPTKASAIISTELVTCKCNNSSLCNNNCKKNSVTVFPAPIPASFTTYRSARGDAVSSDSECESKTKRTKPDEDELEDSDSESITGSSSSDSGSSSGEEEDKHGRSDHEDASTNGQNQGQDDASSESEEEALVQIRQSTRIGALRRSGVTTRNSNNQLDSGSATRGLRSLNRTAKKPDAPLGTTRKPTPLNRDESGDSESEGCSSTASSASAGKPEHSGTPRRKRLRKRK